MHGIFYCYKKVGSPRITQSSIQFLFFLDRCERVACESDLESCLGNATYARCVCKSGYFRASSSNTCESKIYLYHAQFVQHSSLLARPHLEFAGSISFSCN